MKNSEHIIYSVLPYVTSDYWNILCMVMYVYITIVFLCTYTCLYVFCL